MAKGQDAIARKKNKVSRKRMRSREPVSARIAAIIASKKRRKAGKRRNCEGMCFTLPTPDDPFNDRNDPKAKRDKKVSLKLDNGKIQRKENGDLVPESLRSERRQTIQKDSIENGSLVDCSSKFLISCLNAIRKSMTQEDAFTNDMEKALLASRWGVDFWRQCCSGLDILDMSGACASVEQIAWVVSTASDIFTRKEKEGLLKTPFFLFIVQSQEKAAKVRSVCKPLKEVGVHTISLHSGASLDYQVHGLKSCDPEFVVSTPDRLLELVSLSAIDISEVSLLVLDGLDGLISSGFLETIKSVRGCILGSPQTVIFNESYGKASLDILQSLTREPVCRLSIRECSVD